MNDVQSTHWQDCYQEHHQCAIARMQKAEEEIAVLRKEASEVVWLRAEVERLKAEFSTLGNLLGDPIGGDFQCIQEAIIETIAEVERLREAAQWVYNDGSTRLCVPEDLLNVLKRALEGE